jgi:hypothetical protein
MRSREQPVGLYDLSGTVLTIMNPAEWDALWRSFEISDDFPKIASCEQLVPPFNAVAIGKSLLRPW